jgi:hypothetical protein
MSEIPSIALPITRRNLMRGAVVSCSAVLAGCERIVGDRRFRVTLIVDTPNGLREGSSIVRAYMVRNNGLPGPRSRIGFQGEAVFVDLGGGKNLILTTSLDPLGYTSDGWTRLWMSAYGVGLDGDVTPYWTGEQRLQGRRTLDPRHWPTIISYRDLNDPDSGEIVLAYERTLVGAGRGDDKGPYRSTLAVNRVSDVLGPGHSVQSVVLEMMPDRTPITTEIERQIPFLRNPAHQLRLRPTILSVPARFQPTISLFRMEMKDAYLDR